MPFHPDFELIEKIAHRLARGERMTILHGANGSGKTVTLAMLAYPGRPFSFGLESSLDPQPAVRDLFARVGSQVPPGGEGLLRLVALVDWLEKLPTGWVAMLDNVGEHMHLTVQEVFVEWLLATFPERQFVIATHSPYVTGENIDYLLRVGEVA